jgi:hypothetical protein
MMSRKTACPNCVSSTFFHVPRACKKSLLRKGLFSVVVIFLNVLDNFIPNVVKDKTASFPMSDVQIKRQDFNKNWCLQIIPREKSRRIFEREKKIDSI